MSLHFISNGNIQLLAMETSDRATGTEQQGHPMFAQPRCLVFYRYQLPIGGFFIIALEIGASENKGRTPVLFQMWTGAWVSNSWEI